LFLSFSIVLISCFIAGAGQRTDTLYTSGGAYLTRLSTPAAGITRANIDTSKIRALLVDSLKLNNLTAGYMPYANSVKKLVNSSIFTDGTNVAVGKGSVAAWVGSYRAIEVGGNAAIMGRSTETGADNAFFTSNAYFDGAWKSFAIGASAMLRIGTNGLAFFYNSSLTANTAFTPTIRASIDTAGAGSFRKLTADTVIVNNTTANTLLMSNASKSTVSASAYNAGTNTITANLAGNISGATGTFTGNVNVDSLNSTKGIKATTFTGNLAGNISGATGTFTGNVNVDSLNSTKGIKATTGTFSTGITIAGGSQLTTYIAGTFPCTVKTDCVTAQRISMATYTRIGNVVTVALDSLNGTSNSTDLKIYCNLPYLPKYMAGLNVSASSHVTVLDNGVRSVAEIQFGSAAYIAVSKVPSSSYGTGGVKGFYVPVSFFYIAN
jgi:hypothetical protein